MDGFEFNSVGRIVFGRGTFSRVGELAGGFGRRAMVISNASEPGAGGPVDALSKQLAAAGVIARARGRSGLAEEHPDAYKDIDAVVDCVTAAGLSRKVARLTPVGVIKG